jgi:hypothetical protein
MYGALNKVDVEILEKSLARYIGKPMTLLEVGIHTGTTARGIKEFCDRNWIKLTYFGVDVNAPEICPPFDGANFVRGDSAEVFHLVPSELDVVFIDGCHCRNHVVLDTLNYGEKVKLGGLMLFHDCSSEIAHTMRDPHGPNIPEFYNSVLAAHRLLKFPSINWELLFSDYERGHQYGGINVYRKVRL